MKAEFRHRFREGWKEKVVFILGMISIISAREVKNGVDY
jgi:hypothetical protein